MAKFAWGSSQYDELADLWKRASKHGAIQAAARLVELDGWTVDLDLNNEMLVVLKDGKLGEMFRAWRNCSKDLWYALAEAEEMLFTHGIYMVCDGHHLSVDHPVRQAIVAVAATDYGLLTEDDFKGFDT